MAGPARWKDDHKVNPDQLPRAAPHSISYCLKLSLNYRAHAQNKARNEFERIEKFKGKLGKNAIYHIYTDMPTFEAAFRQHLAGVMNELLAKEKTKLK